MITVLCFGVNLLLLMGANHIAGQAVCRWRMILASAGGTAWMIVYTMFSSQFTCWAIFWVSGMFMMSVAAFGIRRDGIRQGFWFFYLNVVLTGILSGSGKTPLLIPLILLSGFVAFMAPSGICVRRRGKYYDIRIRSQKEEISLHGFLDTGNHLTDPISGERIMIIGLSSAKRLSGLSRAELEDPVQTIQNGSYQGLRLIPYRTINCEKGMLLAMRCAVSMNGGKEQRRLVALAPTDFCGTDVLVGGSVV